MDTDVKRGAQVFLGNAHDRAQFEAMERAVEFGICPFCEEHLGKIHKQPVLWKEKYWFVTRNQYAYREAKQHLLIISRKHVEGLEELPGAAFAEFPRILRWIQDEFRVEGGGIALRFGDLRYNGATVRHLHWQFLVPYRPDEKDDYEPIRFYIGARKIPLKPRNYRE